MGANNKKLSELLEEGKPRLIWTASHGAEFGSGKLIGYFQEKKAAKAAAANKGWYGGDGNVGSFLALKLGDQLYSLSTIKDVELTDATKLTEEAIAKAREKIERAVTPLEMEVLGLSKEE